MKKNNKAVLIIEDESVVALELESFTKSKGFNVVGVVDNYNDAFTIIQEQTIDILLCDIYIKGSKSGIDFVEDAKKYQEFKVIYLTAFADEDTISKAIDTAPSSYLTKPFKREELYIALKLASKEEKVCNIGYGYSYNEHKQLLLYENEIVALGKKEHILLQLLIKKKGKIVTFEELEYVIWPYQSVSDSTRRTLIYRLNKKLKVPLIITISGIGYSLSI